METIELAKIVPEQSVFTNAQAFEQGQRIAKMLSSSDLIPKEYRGNIQNTMIALEMANRIGASPLMVMQNLYIVNGRPGWSSTFIIAAINNSGRFTPLKFEKTGDGDSLKCRAWAIEKDTKEKVIGPWITIDMAKAEGWLGKSGSKWKTMPELMIMYRAAAFFGRLYCSETMMGMLTVDEVEDIQVITPTKEDKERERIKLLLEECDNLAKLEEYRAHVPEDMMGIWLEKKEFLTNKN